MAMAITITMAMQASQTLGACFLLPAVEPADRLPLRPDASSCAAFSTYAAPAAASFKYSSPLKKRLRTFPVLSVALLVQRECSNMAEEAGGRRCGERAMAVAAGAAISDSPVMGETEPWLIQNSENRVNLGRELEYLRIRLMSLERSVLESQWTSLEFEEALHDDQTSSAGNLEQVIARVSVCTEEPGFLSGADMETVKSGRPSARKRRLKARREAGLSFERSPMVYSKREWGVQNIEEGEKRVRSKRKPARGFQAFFLRDNRKKQLTEAEQMALWDMMRSAKHLIAGKNRLQEQLGIEPSEKMWASYMSVTPHELVTTLREAKVAQNKLVNANLRLVVMIARRYQHLGMDLADLIQEGTIGLVKGVEKFDNTRGFKFSTYAHWWILQAITRALARMSRAIRLPYHLHEAVCRIRRIQSLEAGNEPISLEDLSKTLKLPSRRVRLALHASSNKLKSMDEPLPRNSDNGKHTLHQLVADPHKDDHPLCVVETPHGEETFERYVKAHLLPREHQIIQLRYGLSQQYVYPVTRDAIGQFCGLSRERVRQLEKVALGKLRSLRQELDLVYFRSQ